MRDAVDTTRLLVKTPTDEHAASLGYENTLKHVHSRGRLSRKEYFRRAATRSGQLKEFKAL